MSEEKKTAKQPEQKKEKERLLTKPDRKGRHINKLLVFLRILVVPIYWLFLPFRFIGNRKVPDGAYIYVGNHFRVWDIVFPACTTWETVHYLAKRDVLKMPVIGAICRRVGVISVNRDGDDLRAVMESMKCLKNGEKIVIFPEGTRNKSEEELLPFKGGAALLSIKTRTPVVPIMQCKKSRPFRLNPILIGDPIEFTEYYDRKLTSADYEEADRKLREHMEEMRRNYLASRKKR